MLGRLRRTFLLCIASLSAFVFEASAATPAFRIEVHPLPTLNLTPAQVLNGETNGPASVIAGELRLPVTQLPKVPAVVFLHGDAGAMGNQPVWIETFNALGIAVFTLDSFTGRGAVSSTSTRGSIEGASAISSLGRVVDAYRALALLSQHPRIDATRIALMGVSSGGRTTLTSAMKRFSRLHASPDTGFAAYIALYPPCNIELNDDEALNPAPVRIFHGAADVITLAGPCKEYVQRLRGRGLDIEFTSFDDAHHGFDNPLGVPLVRTPQAPHTAACMFRETSAGIVNSATGRPVAIDDACVQRGLIGGYNEAAAKGTKQEVEALLRRVFRLAP